MPPAKRSSSSSATSKPAPKSAKRASARGSAAPQAKATATTARKAAGRTATQARAGAGRTAKVAAAGVVETAKESAKAAEAGAGATATTAQSGAKETASRAKATRTRARNTSPSPSPSPSRDTVTLTRARVQEALDSAAERGHITRKDANALVVDIMRRGRSTGEEVGELIGKGRRSLESATKKVRKAEPVDAIVRGADRARRVAGVGPSFPIVGYDDLNVSQVQARIKELTRPEQRKVLTYERKHANRKTVVGALEKSLG